MLQPIKYSSLCVVLLLLLAACTDSTSIQRKYVDDRDVCHAKATGVVGYYFTDYPQQQQPSDKDKTSTSDQLFCDCMKSHGWHTLGCAKPETTAKPANGSAPSE